MLVNRLQAMIVDVDDVRSCKLNGKRDRSKGGKENNWGGEAVRTVTSEGEKNSNRRCKNGHNGLKFEQ